MANKPHFQWAVKANYGGRYAPTLDGEECVKLWYTVGNSLKDVSRILSERGLVNPSTGMPVTRDAVNKAAWRWLFDHPQEAMDKYIRPLCKATGINFTEESFWENYVAHTYSLLSSVQRRKELWKRYGLEDLAREMGERREKHISRRRRLSEQMC